MGFDRSKLQDTISYFESEGLKLSPRGTWRTTSCEFHHGSDSMRINTQTGAWVCMNCGKSGGDILSYHMQRHDMDFRDAAKILNCWIDDLEDRPYHPKPTPLSPRSAISAIVDECNIVAFAALSLSKGQILSPVDKARLLNASAKINLITDAFN